MARTLNEVDLYISRFPKAIQTRLQQIRKTIRQAAPDAEELVSYGMAGYRLQGALVYFAGHAKHIGFYPVPSGISAFEKEIEPYKAAKATVQFRHDEPIPLGLVAKIVRFRAEENKQKAEKKKQARTCKQGHKYYKTSDCPSCPVCETKNKSTAGHFASLSAPARRALQNAGITSLTQLAARKEPEILSLHGMGPASLPKLKKLLKEEGLTFQKA